MKYNFDLNPILIANLSTMNIHDLCQFAHSMQMADAKLNDECLKVMCQLFKQHSESLNGHSGHSLSLMMYSYLKLAKKADIEFI